MTIDRFARDGIALSEFLRAHLHKRKIVLLGISWGTMLGTKVAKMRPDLFSAYVGTGQSVASEEKEEFLYDALLGKARRARDSKSIEMLERIGRPPYKSVDSLLVERAVSSSYDTKAEQGLYGKLFSVVLCAPNYSLWDLYYFQKSSGFALREMFGEFSAFDARKLGPDFQLPFFIINGDEDNVTPMSLSKTYFAWIRAPRKEYLIMRGGGHRVILSNPDDFLRELVFHVRPLILRS